MTQTITIDKSMGVSIGLVITIIGVALWFGSRNAQVDADINTIKRDVASIEENVAAQSERFELYLDSLNSVRINAATDREQIDERIDKVEDRVLLIESELQNEQ